MKLRSGRTIEPSKGKTTLQDIPDEIIFTKMLPFLNAENASKLCKVSKRMNGITTAGPANHKHLKNLVVAAAKGLKLDRNSLICLMVRVSHGGVLQQFLRVHDRAVIDGKFLVLETVDSCYTSKYPTRLYDPIIYDTIYEFLTKLRPGEGTEIDITLYQVSNQHQDWIQSKCVYKGGKWELTKKPDSNTNPAISLSAFNNGVTDILNILGTPVVNPASHSHVQTQSRASQMRNGRYDGQNMLNLLGHNTSVQRFIKPKTKPKGKQITEIIVHPKSTPWNK